jgi:hypothetical protein
MLAGELALLQLLLLLSAPIAASCRPAAEATTGCRSLEQQADTHPLLISADKPAVLLLLAGQQPRLRQAAAVWSSRQAQAGKGRAGATAHEAPCDGTAAG